MLAGNSTRLAVRVGCVGWWGTTNDEASEYSDANNTKSHPLHSDSSNLLLRKKLANYI